MKLRVLDIKNQGDINLEHLIIKCCESTYLGNFLIMKTNSNLDILECVWLPDSVFVNQDTEIYIYTGSPSKIDYDNIHYISLGKDKPLWGQIHRNSLLLLEAKDWQFGYHQ